MADPKITQGLLVTLLERLRFVRFAEEAKHMAYRHPDGMVVLLAKRRSEEPAREPDVVSLKRHLSDQNILSEMEFERWLEAAA